MFNVDSTNMSNNDLTTWGNDVELHGFEGQTDKGLFFDGVDDYISFKSTEDYSKGFTWSFYGRVYSGNNFFSKQLSGSSDYSCRFGLIKDQIMFNTSKKLANSTWSVSQDINNNGNLRCKCNYNLGDMTYIDITFDPQKNQFSAYQNGKLLDTTTTEHDYWHGVNGGKQIFEDNSIDCYLGRYFGGVGKWNYTKLDIYSMRLYNRELNESEIKGNYEKTVTFHNLENEL